MTSRCLIPYHTSPTGPTQVWEKLPAHGGGFELCGVVGNTHEELAIFPSNLDEPICMVEGGGVVELEEEAAPLEQEFDAQDFAEGAAR